MKEIETQIVTIVSEIFDMDIQICKTNINKSFFRDPFNKDVKDLLRLYFRLKKEFNIHFIESDLINYKMYNIKNIITLIEHKENANESNGRSCKFNKIVQ